MSSGLLFPDTVYIFTCTIFGIILTHIAKGSLFLMTFNHFTSKFRCCRLYKMQQKMVEKIRRPILT